MKKFIFAVFIILIVGFCLAFPKNLCFFCKQESNEIGKTSNVQYSGADLGFLSEKVAEKCIYYEEDGEIIGECVFLSLSSFREVANKIGLVVLKEYYVGSRKVIEGVSAMIKFAIAGRQSNVQVCIDGKNVQMASPIIYGSFWKNVYKF